jgi:flavin reductase (DIM6/NTAB) family NADH-FMN oxidoreductase RutF
MQNDPKALRHALGRYATGVTLITCQDRTGQRLGLTANSFNSLSLDPPLVLWALRTASTHLHDFEQASHFAVNVLGQTQLALSQRFASPVPDRFALGDWREGEGGSPVLAGCAAVFECVTEQQLLAGDHVLFIGRVLRFSQDAQVPPLLYQGGSYRALGEAL